MLCRWVLLASFRQALVNSIWGQWLSGTPLQCANIGCWLLISGWLQFQASHKETSGSLTCFPTQVCTLMQANYVLVDILHHFNCSTVGGNPKLKEDEWRWQDEGRYHENGRFGRRASGVLTSAGAAIKSRLWDLVPNGIKVPNIVP